MLPKVENNNKYTYPFYLTLIWICCIILVNPVGDFPLNDDWSYAHNVKAMALDNEIVFHDWGAMTLIVHTIWGALFCKIFGFSFTVLRASTLIMGWWTLLVTFLFFQEGGVKRKYAFKGTLLLAFNFFFFANSFTYMTEVPFMFFFMSAAYFFLKAINDKGNVNVLYAILFSVLATLIRQIGVLIPMAFFFVFIIKNKFSIKTIFQSVLPSVITFASLFLFVHWRGNNYGLSKNFGNASDMLENFYNGRFLYALEHKSYGFFVFWGLFLMPLLISLVPFFWKKYSWVSKLGFVVVTLLFCYPFIMIPDKTFMGNTFANLGVGPFVIPSSSTQTPISLGMEDWGNLYTFSFIAAIFLVKWIFIKIYELIMFIKNKKSDTVNWATLFALVVSFGYFLFLILNNYHFDRYSLVAFPFLINLLLPQQQITNTSKIFKWTALVSFFIIAGYSIGSTHDYLSWNRARWVATDYAIQDLKSPIDNIIGGMEFNGKHGIESYVPLNWDYLENWNAIKFQYKIAFSQQCKYKSVKSIPYQRYFPPRVDSIFLLQKEYLSNFDTIFCDLEKISDDGKYLLTNQEDILIQNVGLTSSKTFNGENAILLDKDNQYGFTFKLKNVEPCEKIWVSVWASPLQNANSVIMVGNNFQYIHNDYRLAVNAGNDWGKSNQEFHVPAEFKGDELTFYFYNGSGNEIWLDDLMIVRMK